MATGDNATTLTDFIRQGMLAGWQRRVDETVDLLSYFPPTPAPDGNKISWEILYGHTDNSASFSDGDPMESPNNSTFVKVYYNKSPHQATAKVTGLAKRHTVGSEQGIDAQLLAIDETVMKLAAKINTAMWTRFEAAIDSAGTFSDAAVTRSTYSIASGEESTTTSLQLATMDAAVTSMVNTRKVPHQNLVWLMPWPLISAYTSLAGGTTNYPMNQMPTNVVDAASMFNSNGQLPTHQGIQILPTWGQTSTTCLLIDREQVSMLRTSPGLEVIPKDTLEYAYVWECVDEVDLIYKNPYKAYKLGNKS